MHECSQIARSRMTNELYIVFYDHRPRVTMLEQEEPKVVVSCSARARERRTRISKALSSYSGGCDPCIDRRSSKAGMISPSTT